MLAGGLALAPSVSLVPMVSHLLKNKCLWLKYPLWFRKKPQDLNSRPQVAIQAHKKQCNAITESWISGVPKSRSLGQHSIPRAPAPVYVVQAIYNVYWCAERVHGRVIPAPRPRTATAAQRERAKRQEEKKHHIVCL